MTDRPKPLTSVEAFIGVRAALWECVAAAFAWRPSIQRAALQKAIEADIERQAVRDSVTGPWDG